MVNPARVNPKIILALIFNFYGLFLKTEGLIYQSKCELCAVYDFPLETWEKFIS